jgi:hypothetical protein
MSNFPTDRPRALIRARPRVANGVPIKHKFSELREIIRKVILVINSKFIFKPLYASSSICSITDRELSRDRLFFPSPQGGSPIHELDASTYNPPSIPGSKCRGILGGVIRGKVWLIEMPPPADRIPPRWLEPGGKTQNAILRIGPTRWRITLRESSRNCPDGPKIVATSDPKFYFVLTLLPVQELRK